MARPLTGTTLALTDTSTATLVVGGAVGATAGTGTILSGPIKLSSGVPVDNSMKLYNNSGTLTWNGIVLAAGSSLSGTTGTIPVFTAPNAVGDSIVTQTGGNTITVTGTFNATTAIQLNGTSINTGGTLTNVAYLNQSQTFNNASGQKFSAGISIDGGTQSTHGIMMPSAVPANTTTNLHNNAGVLKWDGGMTIGGSLTVSGFGTNTFSAGGVGPQLITSRNTSAGTGNYGGVTVGNDTSANLLALYSFSSTFTSGAGQFASGSQIQANGTAGLSITAADAGGTIRLYAGGTTLQATLQTAGTWTWAAYGAGTITSDASGNLTSVSDERIKDRIAPLPYGLSEVLAVNPIQYGYNADSGLERDNLYGGFSAQNVLSVMPLAVGQTAEGRLSLQDRAILGAVVNAIKELSGELDILKASKPHAVAASVDDPNASAKLIKLELSKGEL